MNYKVTTFVKKADESEIVFAIINLNLQKVSRSQYATFPVILGAVQYSSEP